MPPHAYFVVSAVFHYLGPSFAVLLFARVEVLGVAWLRIASAALIFAAWRRPWRAFAALDLDGRRLLLAWGCVLALMNCCFYLAISRQPLATVAAIEFLPVVGLAALGARTPPQPRSARARGARGLPRDRRPARARAARRGVRVRERRAVRALHRACRSRRQARPRSSGIDGLAASMLIAAVGRDAAGRAGRRIPALGDPRGAGGRRRRGGVVVRDPVRDRPARARAPRARDLRADGLAAAGDRHRHRRARAHADPVAAGRSPASASSSPASRCTASTCAI